MIIKQIKLNNFRQFKGEQIIEFSTDKEKNATIVVARNTGGKTTLLCSFLWCLYEENNLPAPKGILNSILAKALTPYSTQEVSVEITLEHDKKTYVILRTQKFQKSSTGDNIRALPSELKISYKEENGEMQPINSYDCKSIIEDILPQALSDYFFFDGERIGKINSKSNVVNAVRGLMGLNVYISAMEHLDPQKSSSVIGKLKKELDTGKDDDAERRKRIIEDLKNRLESFKNHTPNIEQQIEYWANQKEEYAKIIKDNDDVRIAQEQLEKAEKEKSYLTNLISSSEARFIDDFNNNACKFFALPLIKNGLNILNSLKEEGVGIPNMHASSIDFILKRGKCICGCDLTKNQGAVECILHEQSLLPPQHIGTSVRNLKTDLENAKEISNLYADNVKNDYKIWLDSQRQLDYKIRDVKEIASKIKGHDDVGKYEIKYQEACQQLERYQTAKQGNHDEIVSLLARISENEKEIEKLFATTDKNKRIKRYCDYAEEIYNWFKNYYDEQEKIVKAELLEKINENFTKIYHGNRKIIMDENYKVVPVLLEDNERLAKSGGLDTVTNFSFILGLVEVARKRANNIDEDNIEEQKTTEAYPIVMDAPFSTTDIEHTSKISDRLSEVAEQVIIFIMDKDWEIAKTQLEKHVGAQYVIEKVDGKENYSTIRREI